MKNGTGINTETTVVGCGPVELDVAHARRQGWSQKAIERAWKALSAISRREGAIAHRNGPVLTCGCIACDQSVSFADLPKEYQKTRASWTKRGLGWTRHQLGPKARP